MAACRMQTNFCQTSAGFAQKRPAAGAGGRLRKISKPSGNRRNYLDDRCTCGAGAGAAWISWNCGIGRRPGGLMSLVQQQEAASIAKAETVSAERMRIMESMAVWVGEGFRVCLAPEVSSGLSENTDGWNLLRWGHVGWLARSGCAARAAGGGEKCGGSGDQGDFHQ